ncbi:MAG TPA: RNA polymerase sigma-70 factor [Streptosporangiaceae bacterium]|nr:RNA polymerase sigma-70 factor [Streptosporangiaceae bacterium]
MDDADAFMAQRELMFSVAYRMLGTVADAEDAVQDAWLRWSAAPRDHVADPRAYLVRTVTNIALNRLRSAQARREAYVGPWLPEPLLTQTNHDVTERAELTESVSVAMLVVLESLTPEERAVFVLREVFDFGYTEIAAGLGRSEPAVRQIAHRARGHVQARRPRFEVDQGRQRAVTARFLAAAVGGDIEGLLEVLAPDVTLTTDGGGRVRAALRPIRGAAKVARALAGIAGRPYQGLALSEMTIEQAEINGEPGALIVGGGRVVAAGTFTVVGGRIAAIQLVTNPEKLDAISARRTLRL